MVATFVVIPVLVVVCWFCVTSTLKQWLLLVLHRARYKSTHGLNPVIITLIGGTQFETYGGVIA